MDAEKRQFILKNRKMFSARQLAKKLDLARSEVERVLGEAPAAAPVRTLPVWAEAAVIFAVAFLFRLVYLGFLKNTPFFEPLSATLDDGVYLKMARDIASGNWIANFPLGAYRIPLYPYFLALLFKTAGPGFWPIHVLQAVLGSFIPVWLYLIGRRIFPGVLAARAAGLIGCFYVPLVFFEHFLLGETLSIFLNLAALAVAVTALGEDRPRAPAWILSGLLLGLSTLVRPNTLIAVFFVGCFLFVRYARLRNVRSAFLVPLALLVGFLAPVVPMAVKNAVVYRDFVPFSALGGINFYIGNNPDADGKFHLTKGVGTSLDEMIERSAEIAQKEKGKSLRPSQVSSFWLGRGMHFAFGQPVHFARLLVTKTVLFFNYYEWPDVLDMDFAAAFLPILRLNLFGFGIVAVLGLAGLVWALRLKDARIVLLAVFLGGLFFSVILFFVTARYRLPAVPLLILFAGAGIRAIVSIPKMERAAAAAVVATVVLAAAIAFRPSEPINFATSYNSLAIALKNKGRYGEAERYYRKAIELAPSYPSPYFNLAKLYDQLGRAREAGQLYATYERTKRLTLEHPEEVGA